MIRRAPKDYSQRLRRGFQIAFLALNVWIGIQFYLFVRFYETTGHTAFADRPAGVEGWLPIAALMNLKLLLFTGRLPVLHPAGLMLLVAFFGASWIFRKSFCGWLCPVGTISEFLWRAGRPNRRLPRWLDIPLRAIKYLLLALFLYAVAFMSVAGIKAFLEGPYGIVDDVKMLNFFRYLSPVGIAIVGLLAAASIFVRNFWCRYLCPYGALMGLAALASPLRIRRDPDACIDCAKCAKACPSALPVDRLITIRSAECTGCLQCVAECPVAGALYLSALRRRRVPAWAMAAGISVLFLSLCGWARLTGHWHTHVPAEVYYELIPHANEFSHP
jgi:polyferredoxin